ncbi:MAG: NAD-dependent epimerase/dehydratase family protein [Candidatus Bathyarchaeaceae archaeon]
MKNSLRKRVKTGRIGVVIKKLSNNEHPIIFGGNHTNDFIYLKDVAQANLLALETTYTNRECNIG